MSDDNLQSQSSTLEVDMPSLARYRHWIELAVGFVAVLVFANLLLGVIDEFPLIRHYLIERGSFIRTQAIVTGLDQSTGFNSGAFTPQRHTVTYEFRRTAGVVRVSRDIPGGLYDDLVVGQPLDVTFYRDDPSISYLRDEEPYIITLVLQLFGLLVSGFFIYRGLIRGAIRRNEQVSPSQTNAKTDEQT
jgi:hypothetical protein